MPSIVSHICLTRKVQRRDALDSGGVTAFGDMSSTPSRDILSTNLQRLIQRDVDKHGPISRRAWAAGKGLDVKLIERLVKKSHAPTLDKLEDIANACGLKAWHLLYDGLDPDAPPADPISAEDRALLERLRSLLTRP